MDYPRLNVRFFDKGWGDLTEGDTGEELDVTPFVLNLSAEDLASTAEPDPFNDGREVLDLIEEDLLLAFEEVERHAINDKQRYCLKVDVDAYADFFKSNGVDPAKLTEQDMEMLRERYDVPKAITMPNGRRFIPDASEGEEVYIEGSILVDLEDLIGKGLEGFVDEVSTRLTGSDLLMDVDYRVVGDSKGSIRVRVSGDAREILSLNQELEDEGSAPSL